MKKRLFIAIEISPKIKEGIIKFQKVLKKNFPDTVLIKPENIHLTLVFLGDTDYNQIPGIISALENLRDDSFIVNLKDLNGFPNIERVHTLWIGVEENSGLFYLQQKICERLKKINFRISEQKFIPHISIAKFNKDKDLKQNSQETQFGSFRVKDFILFESELRNEGSKHTVIKRFLLKHV